MLFRSRLGDHLKWGQKMVAKIRQHTKLPVIYRPRPSHNPIGNVEGAYTSQLILNVEMKRARIVVSHGGNLGWDAIIAGKPHFAIDVSIARPVSETDWEKLDKPFVPDNYVRRQWMANVCYCQWSLDELADGSAWRVIREQLELIG